MGTFPFMNYPTISVDCECKGATAVGSRRHKTFPYVSVFSIVGNSQTFLVFRFILSNFIAVDGKMAAIMLQTIPSFYAKISEKSLFVSEKHMKNTLFVKTTASPITTIRRVFYPFVNITLY